MEQIDTVKSLCPECLRKIEGIKYVENGKVYIRKECEEHGKFTILISRDVEHYKKMEGCYEAERAKPKTFLNDAEKGCPFDCGLCPSHKQDTCIAVLEVTSRCDMGCTFCFANSTSSGNDPDMATIKKMFETVKQCSNDPTCVQISGGEPTLRNDLPEIIKLGRDMGISHIELNTNGNRLADDPSFLNEIVDAGIDAIYLGFDGISDGIYNKRHKKMNFSKKAQVIDRCEKVGIGVVLVPLVSRDYNLHEVGKIIDFASSKVPTVRGVHFQPAFFSGRYPSEEGRITIFDLLEEVEDQMEGKLKITNFTPSLMPHAHCGATCLVVVDEYGNFIPLTNISLGAVESTSDIARKTKNSIMGRWKGMDESSSCCSKEVEVKSSCCTQKLEIKSSCCSRSDQESKLNSDFSNGWADFIELSKENYLTISAMGFQDAWTYEQDRVENCCIHVVTENGKFIPFCNYNLTNCKGEYLYRNTG